MSEFFRGLSIAYGGVLIAGFLLVVIIGVIHTIWTRTRK